MLTALGIVALVILVIGTRESMTNEERQKNREWGRKHGDKKWGKTDKAKKLYKARWYGRNEGDKKWGKKHGWKKPKPNDDGKIGTSDPSALPTGSTGSSTDTSSSSSTSTSMPTTEQIAEAVAKYNEEQRLAAEAAEKERQNQQAQALVDAPNPLD
jgi:hypothetical protein